MPSRSPLAGARVAHSPPQTCSAGWAVAPVVATVTQDLRADGPAAVLWGQMNPTDELGDAGHGSRYGQEICRRQVVTASLGL
jgi:hypothetical protein